MKSKLVTIGAKVTPAEKEKYLILANSCGLTPSLFFRKSLEHYSEFVNSNTKNEGKEAEKKTQESSLLGEMPIPNFYYSDFTFNNQSFENNRREANSFSTILVGGVMLLACVFSTK